jgi:hypothetical protein
MKAICIRASIFFLAAFIFSACATHKINWAERVGNYTYDQAVLELGPPDKAAKLSNGITVAEWLTSHGNGGYAGFIPGPYPAYSYPMYEPATPERFLRLTFDANGRLTEWRRVIR